MTTLDEMSLEHLDLLHSELPELFQDRDLAPHWHEDLMIVPVTDPEKVTDLNALEFQNYGDRHPAQWTEFLKVDSELADGDMFEAIAPYHVEPGEHSPEFPNVVAEVLGGSHVGAPLPYVHRQKMPPPDYLAFYLPFHYYHPDWWGVYLLYEGIFWLAGQILARSNNRVAVRRAFDAARLFLYYHEALHHKTECFAIQLELTHRKAFFKTGFDRYYQRTLGSDDCLEEGLGNTSAQRDSWDKLSDQKVDSALAQYIDQSPPGYSQDNAYRSRFLRVRCGFAEDN